MRRFLILVPLLLAAVPARAGEVTRGNFEAGGLKSEWVLSAPKDDGGYGLLVFLHADGGAEGYARAIDAVAGPMEAEKLVTLAVKAPSGRNWHDQGLKQAAFLDELLEKEIRGKRKLDPTRTFFAGVSGGAVFVNGFFLPLYGWKYRGGALLLCGGVKSLVAAGDMDVFNMGEGDAFKRGFRFFYKVAKDDFIYKQASRGAETMKALGFTVVTDEPTTGGHCGFDVAAALKAGLAALK